MRVFTLIFPDLLLIVSGFLLCRLTPFKTAFWESIEQLVYYVLFPVLLAGAILRNPLNLGHSLNFIVAAVALVLTLVAASYSINRAALYRYFSAKTHAASAQTAFRFNTYIVLSLATRLLGNEGQMLMALLVGLSVPMVNIAAVYPMARHGEHHFVNQLAKNPLIIATVSSLLLNLAGLTIPTIFEPTLNRISTTSLTLGLMLTGVGLRLGALLDAKLLTALLLLIKHLIAPVIAWTLARWLHLDGVQTAVLLIFAAVPTASSCYVLATRMGYDGSLVASLVTLSTLVGIVSLTVVLHYLNI